MKGHFYSICRAYAMSAISQNNQPKIIHMPKGVFGGGIFWFPTYLWAYRKGAPTGRPQSPYRLSKRLSKWGTSSPGKAQKGLNDSP
jgi:hypothetical protein